MSDIYKHQSNNTVRLLGPVNEDNGTTVDAGTCIAKLFDDVKDTTLTADVAAGVKILPVEDASKFVNGDDIIAVFDSSGAWFDGGVTTAIDVTAKTITVTNGLTFIAQRGARVSVQLGGDIAMSAFGTPVVGTFDWGFRGPVTSNHASMKPGMIIRTERRLDASSIILTEITRDAVVGGT